MNGSYLEIAVAPESSESKMPCLKMPLLCCGNSVGMAQGSATQKLEQHMPYSDTVKAHDVALYP